MFTQGGTLPEVTANNNARGATTDVGGEAMIPTVTNPTFHVYRRQLWYNINTGKGTLLAPVSPAVWSRKARFFSTLHGHGSAPFKSVARG